MPVKSHLGPVAIDFETYYSQEYSLTKLTTEEYIRDARFEVIGVSVAEDGAEPVWVYDNVETYLCSLKLDERVVVAHNGLFDFAILAWRYDIHPRIMACTLKMARPFHRVVPGLSLAKLSSFYGLPDKGTYIHQMKGRTKASLSLQELEDYGRLYANRDAQNCLALFHILREKLPPLEMAAIHIILEMFTKPALRLNQRKLVTYTKQVLAEKHNRLEALRETINAVKGNTFLRDADQCRTWVRSLSGLEFLDRLTENILPRTGKTGRPSLPKTHTKTQELLESEDDLVRTFVEARLGVQSSLDETRAKRFLGISTRGLLPIPLNYYGAHTGRLAGTDKINMQNLPSRTGRALKETIEAPEGYVLLDADLSQIEARLCAVFCGQQDLANAFAQNVDVYSQYASERYGRPITRADKTERTVGKVSILSLQYGVGHMKYRDMLRIMGGVIVSPGDAAEGVNFYRNRYTFITRMWRILDLVILAMTQGQAVEINEWCRVEGNRIYRPNGMFLDYPGLVVTPKPDGLTGVAYAGSTGAYINAAKAALTGNVGEDAKSKSLTWLYGAKVLENIIQALAGDVIREKMVQIHGRYPVLLQVHDSLLIMAPRHRLHDAHDFVYSVMRQRPSWMPTLPVDCEIGVGRNYGEMSSLDAFIAKENSSE